MKLPLTLRLLVPTLILASLGWMLQGCAGTRREAPPEPPDQTVEEIDLTGMEVPPGVDTAVAREATRAARHFMIGMEADSLSQLYKDRALRARERATPLVDLYRKGSAPPVSPPDPADTMRAFEITIEVDEQLAAVEELLGAPVARISWDEMQQIRPQIRERAAAQLESARDNLQQALTHNPWDPWSRQQLVWVLQDLAFIHESLNNIDKAIEQTQIVMGAVQSDYGLAWDLANLQKLAGDTIKALQSLRHAEDLLLTWAELPQNPGDTPERRQQLDYTDYANWMELVAQQVEIERAMLMGNNLMVDATRLKALAANAAPKDSVYDIIATNMLKLIGWDEGNIYTAIGRESINELLAAGNYEGARGIIRKVRPNVRSLEAKLHLDTLAALLDFNFLDRPEPAIERLRSILVDGGYSEADSSLDTLLVNRGPEGFAQLMRNELESLPDRLERVVELYGQFTTTHALELQRTDRTREKAFVYFYQSALVPHQNQAFALMALADMSTQEPNRAVRYGEAALVEELPSSLSEQNRMTLYERMVSAYRNLNDLNEAEKYFQLLQEAG